MEAAESTDESADDMTAADTAPRPTNVTHEGHRYCITMGSISFWSSCGIGIGPFHSVWFQSEKTHQSSLTRVIVRRAFFTLMGGVILWLRVDCHDWCIWWRKSGIPLDMLIVLRQLASKARIFLVKLIFHTVV